MHSVLKIGAMLFLVLVFTSSFLYAQTEKSKGEAGVVPGAAPTMEPAPELSKDMEAMQLLSQSRESLNKRELEKAGELAEKAQKLSPENAEVIRLLIEVYRAQAEVEKAQKLLMDALVKEESLHLGDWAMYEYYNVAQRKGVKDGLESLEKTQAKHPDNLELQRAIAEGYTRIEDWAKATEQYEKLVKKNPENQMFVNRLIDCYNFQQNHAGVIKILKPLVEKGSEDMMNFDRLVNAYTQADKVDEALKLYKQIIEKEPERADLRTRYADLLMNAEKTDEALVQWRKAFELEPANFWYKQRIGEIYIQLGKLKEAEKEFKELVELSKDDPMYKDTAQRQLDDIKAQKQKK